jgi:UPF0755 protein
MSRSRGSCQPAPRPAHPSRGSHAGHLVDGAQRQRRDKGGGQQSKPRPPRAKRRAGASRSSAWALGPLPARARLGLLAAALVLGIVLLGFGAFVLMPGPGPGRTVEIEWPRNATVAMGSNALTAVGLVRSGWLLRAYCAIAPGFSEIKPGTHLLSDDMSPRTLLRRLRRLPSGASTRVVIPEGFNKFEIARRLHDAGVCSARAFITSTLDASLLQELRLGSSDAEGYLFPATYELLRNAEPREVVRKMVLESDRRFARLFDQYSAGLLDLRSALGWGKHEVIILASLVEKEAAVDDERPLIASVFLNRLRDPSTKPDKRKLQSDPTARYGCFVQKLPTCEGADSKPTPAMVHDPSNPYSTYAHAGLTPGPIANPGEKSVQAVLAPTHSRYMFFVAKGAGRHAFSETLEEHNNALRGGHPK